MVIGLNSPVSGRRFKSNSLNDSFILPLSVLTLDSSSAAILIPIIQPAQLEPNGLSYDAIND